MSSEWCKLQNNLGRGDIFKNIQTNASVILACSNLNVEVFLLVLIDWFRCLLNFETRSHYIAEAGFDIAL